MLCCAKEENMNVERIGPKQIEACMVSIPDSLKLNLLKQSDIVQGRSPLQRKMSSNSKNLAGQLQEQFVWAINEELRNYLVEVCKSYNSIFEKPANELKAIDCWFNYQQKYEYNPVHFHYGNLSFVIWLSIPYDLNEEDRCENTKRSHIHYNGRFCFYYIDKQTMSVAPFTINTGKDFEGKMILFPSNLQHCVYPFYTSDQFRISLAGNIQY